VLTYLCVKSDCSVLYLCLYSDGETAEREGERESEEEGAGVAGEKGERGGGFAQEPGEPPELDGWPVTSLHSGG